MRRTVNILNHSGFFSHHVWINKNELLSFTEVKGKKSFFLWSEEED